MYLTTVLQYMSYLNDKARAEKAQAELESQLRKTKGH